MELRILGQHDMVSDKVEKKKISAKAAVADIRSGMSDADLMNKYVLSNAGLQSLFDKLVAKGYIDLSEILERTAAFLGTVDISEYVLSPEAVKAEDAREPVKSKAERLVNAHEAARDIRSGMDDSALMQKYRLSAKGLPSLFKKLMQVGLIQQSDIDHRNLGFEHTVALTEDMLSLSAAFQALGMKSKTVAGDKSPHRPQAAKEKEPTSAQCKEPAPRTEWDDKSATSPEERPKARPSQPEPSQTESSRTGSSRAETTQTESSRAEPGRVETSQAELHHESFSRSWYDNPSTVVLLLIFLFPLGVYACYRNASLSPGTKAFAIVICLLLAMSGLFAVSLLANWPLPRFL